MPTVEERLNLLEAQVARLQPDNPRFGQNDFHNAMRDLRPDTLTPIGTFVLPGGVARANQAGDFEINAYVSGSDLILQVWSQALGEWKTFTSDVS